MKNQKHSLRKRFSHKLFSNFVKFGLGLVTIGIIPRSLGPEMYGNYGFLTNFFSRTFKFSKLGVSSAYVTKLSSTPTDYKLIGFYTIYILIVFLISLFSLSVLGIFNKLDILFPGIEEKFIYLAFLLTFLQFVFTQITSTHDATLLTLISEKIVLFNAITACLSILLLYFFDNISLNSILILYISITSVCIILGLISLFFNKYNIFKCLIFRRTDFSIYTKKIFSFSYPLIVHSLVVFTVSISDRWMLQHFYGSTEQGFFTLGFKLSSVIFLFSTALIPLIARDFAIQFKDGLTDVIKSTIFRLIPLFFFFNSLFTVFVSINCESICFFIGGDDYNDAKLVVSLLVLYSIHQTYGQIFGSLFLAMEKTKFLRNTSLVFGLIGFITSYIILSPNLLNLGATGLAIKLLLIQFILVNTYILYVSKHFEISYFIFLNHQIFVLAVLFVIGTISYFTIDVIDISIFFKFLVSGFFYLTLCLMTLYYFPKVFLLDTFYYERIISYLSRFKSINQST